MFIKNYSRKFFISVAMVVMTPVATLPMQYVKDVIYTLVQAVEHDIFAIFYGVDFSEKFLDKLLDQGRHEEVIDLLHDYVENGHINSDPSSYISNRIRAWIFMRLDQCEGFRLAFQAAVMAEHTIAQVPNQNNRMRRRMPRSCFVSDSRP